MTRHPTLFPRLPPAGAAPTIFVPSDTGIALALAAWAAAAGPHGHIHIAASEPQTERLSQALAEVAADCDVLPFPAVDDLPYDRGPPSLPAMARRLATLRRGVLCAPRPFIVMTTAEAALTRSAPRASWDKTALRIAVGDHVSIDEIAARLAALGYLAVDQVGEIGESATHGSTVDVWPGHLSTPLRLTVEDGRAVRISLYGPETQRSVGETEEAVLGLVRERDESGLLPGDATPPTLFDIFDRASLSVAEESVGRARLWADLVREAYEQRLTLLKAAPEGAALSPPSLPERLYLTAEGLAQILRDRSAATLLARPRDHAAEGIRALDTLATAADPVAAAVEMIAAQGPSSHVILAGEPNHVRLRRIARRLRALGRTLHSVAHWSEALAVPPPSIARLAAPLPGGFRTDGRLLLTAADLDGGPAAARGQTEVPTLAAMRCGDHVIDREHGLGILRGLETLIVEGEPQDHVQIAFHGGVMLAENVSEMDRLWRYAGADVSVPLDRLRTAKWTKLRTLAEAEVADTAKRLKLAVDARRRATAAAVPTDSPELARFAARFRHEPSTDQTRAIADTFADLASGRPMDRLIFGDVGFGKTEIALRAAAAVALAHQQVAVVTPTVVLAQQHLDTFRRRFASFGLRIEILSSHQNAAQQQEIKAALAAGEIDIVIGSRGLAANDVTFARLGLVIIDEEHRFGTAQKQSLKDKARGAHLLALSATPIPRTLEAALVGLRDFSILRTPPVARHPVQTLVMPFAPEAVRSALIREKRRGGQSFVVCPRIANLGPTERRLRKLVPTLRVAVAHGQMDPDRLDATMLEFASGEHDVLLATNIIESGLDIPNANTMLVLRPERFGIADLHQLRGRVGRGARLASAYFLTGRAPGPAAERLDALVRNSALGAGLSLAESDLEARGAGALLGPEQSGHIKLFGAELYRALLMEAVQGRSAAPPPRIAQGLHIPPDYIPDPDTRIDLYRRVAGLVGIEAAEDLAEEIADRFGTPPPAVARMLESVVVRERCRRMGVVNLEVGPRGIAVTVRRAARQVRVRFVFKKMSRRSFARPAALHRVLDRVERLRPEKEPLP